MAKTYKNLYHKIYDFQNLYEAYIKARKNKRYRREVIFFSMNLEENLISIQNDLIWESYHTGEYRQFYVHDPKTRLVLALPFKDRVVQHAIVNIIEPVFEKTFIFDSYACRLGKGTHAGADRLTKFLTETARKWRKTYCLKADIKKFFYSIDHQALKDVIRRKIACPQTMRLLEGIVDSSGEQVGIPIGNLTSQLFANIYLNELDYFIKHTFRCHYYIRYMDDFVILHDNKQELHRIKREVEDFLRDKLRLELNSKTQVFPASQGINFLGYRIWRTHRKVRNSSKRRIKRKLKAYQRKYAAGQMSIERIKATIISWLGHVKHANSYFLRQKLSKILNLKGGINMLTQGSVGIDVKELQSNLKSLGFYLGRIDGEFGPVTASAVKAFQQKYGLQVDGVAGSMTQAKIREVLAGRPLPLAGVTVLLDKGHEGLGEGLDPGAVDDKKDDGIYTAEAALVDNLGNIVADDLRSAGANVIETREGNKPLSWDKRKKIIAASGAKVSISLHANSASPAAVGIETFAYTSKKSTLLAACIQGQIILATGAVNRGAKFADFFMVRVPEKHGMKAVLIEVGFISNPAEEAKLNGLAYQKKISTGIKAGLIAARNKSGI